MKEVTIQTVTYGSGDRMFIDGEEVMRSVPDVTNMYSVEQLAEDIVRQVKESRMRMCGSSKPIW
ncbi:putative peptidoglycan binding domain protein [Latilactobacillus sakei]|nr:putative peptidoglycan binding domain protein [Latilactobacillus sakei]